MGRFGNDKYLNFAEDEYVLVQREHESADGPFWLGDVSVEPVGALSEPVLPSLSTSSSSFVLGDKIPLGSLAISLVSLVSTFASSKRWNVTGNVCWLIGSANLDWDALNEDVRPGVPSHTKKSSKRELKL